MADDRSSGFFGGSSFVRFNSQDTVTGIPDKKRSRSQNSTPEKDDEEKDKEEVKTSEYVDRSAQLSATLNSLAAQNFVNVIKNKSDNKAKKYTVKAVTKPQ